MKKALTEVLSDGICFLANLGDASSRCLDALLLEELHRQVLVYREESLLLLAGNVHAGLSPLKEGRGMTCQERDKKVNNPNTNKTSCGQIKENVGRGLGQLNTHLSQTQTRTKR